MNMISHQAICPYFKFVFLAVVLEGLTIKTVILVIEKYSCAVIAALRDMMGEIIRLLNALSLACIAF